MFELLEILSYILYFFLWSFFIYWIHRIVHNFPVLSRLHRAHHSFVKNNTIVWHWSNIFLFNDDWPSTIDYWLTEVIPTIIFSWITGQWWITIGFYIYAATIQERLEHNNKFSLYPFYTSGQWHLLHHTKYHCNYGIGTPFWDVVFGTNKKLNY